MVEGTQTRMKRKAVLIDLMENMVTQDMHVVVLDDDDVKSEEMILNLSVVDIMDNFNSAKPNCYAEVMDFIKNVCCNFKFGF